jgi:uncharacterized peroxidase-related enzyme
MPFLRIIPETEATGPLAELYRRLAYQDGSVDETYKALSLNLPLLTADAAMYEVTMYGESPLSRNERELLALTVSRVNGCERCFRHHAARYSELKASAESGGPGRASLEPPVSNRETMLAAFAEKLTRAPASITAGDIENLRGVGLDDRGILDACNTVAYFNYVNRMTLGLGLSPEGEPPGHRPGRV